MSEELKEPSGFVTKDGKDIDERFLKPDELTSNEIAVDSICDTVLENLGVAQQDPINSATSPYTLPADCYVTFKCTYFLANTKLHTDSGGMTMYVNDEVVFQQSGTATVTADLNYSKTIKGFYKAGTIFKYSVWSSTNKHTATFSVVANPMFLYKYDSPVDEETKNA